MSKRCAVVLAAGQGTRMKSSRVKVLHHVAGRPMVERVVRAALDAGCDPVVVVVGYQGDEVRAALDGLESVRFAVQTQQRGTGDAVRAAADELSGVSGTALLIPGDVPLIRPQTLDELATAREVSDSSVTVLSMVLDDAAWYGRIVRDGEGGVQGIVEARDCDDSQRAIREVNTGFYAVDLAVLWDLLGGLTTDNDQGELYLTDIVAGAAAGGHRADRVVHPEESEVLGINDRAELARAEGRLYRRVASEWMANGVSLRDPSSTRIDPEVTLAHDVEIGPGAQIRGVTRVDTGVTVGTGAILEDCTVAEGASIGPGCVLQCVDIGAGATLRPYTVACGVDEKRPAESGPGDRVGVGAGSRIGPFSHLRMRTDLQQDVHVGNFVETKNTKMEAGAKANHLAYLGDGRIGERSNVGAGVIFCNYDGLHKHRTEIGADVFIGSDSQLVAPVAIGDRAYVGSGTTVTRDVPDGALMVTRTRPRTLEGVGDRKFARIRAEKGKGTGKGKERGTGTGEEGRGSGTGTGTGEE